MRRKQRWRHQYDRACHGLSRRDGLGRGPARDDDGLQQAERIPLQYAHRHQQSVLNSDSGTGPAVLVTGVAGFGAPVSATGQGNAGFDFKQNIWQVLDNFTYIRSAHSYKFGFDWQHIYDGRTVAPQWVYTFPSSAAYLAAKSGANPLGYSTMTQLTGDRDFNMSTNLFSLFVQDDWQIAPTVKVLYGLRYDLYRYPAGLAEAPLAQTRSFNTDKNNLARGWCRLVDRFEDGASRQHRHHVRSGASRRYEQALQISGSPRAPAFTFNGTSAGARRFRAP